MTKDTLTKGAPMTRDSFTRVEVRWCMVVAAILGFLLGLLW